MHARLRLPGDLNDGDGSPALPCLQRPARKRMGPVLPGGLDQDAPEMRVARFRDHPARRLRATRVFRRHQASERHEAGGGRKAPRVTELPCNRPRGQLIDPAEAPQALDACAPRLERQQLAQLGINGLEAAKRLLHRAGIRPVCLLERWQRLTRESLQAEVGLPYGLDEGGRERQER